MIEPIELRLVFDLILFGYLNYRPWTYLPGWFSMSFSRMFSTALRFLIVSSSFWRRLLLRITLMTFDRLTALSSGSCGSFLSYFVMKLSMSLMAFSRAISFGLLTIRSLLWLATLLSPMNLLKAVKVLDGMLRPYDGSPLLLRLSLLFV